MLVGLPRLLPPSLVRRGITHEFMGGPATVTDLFDSLMVLRDPDRAMVLPSKIFPLHWWEQDYYIGLLGLGVAVAVWGAGAAVARPLAQIGAGAAAGGLPDLHGFLDRAGVWRDHPRGAHSAVYRRAGNGALLCRAAGALLVLAAIFLPARAGPAQADPWVQLIILGLSALLFHDLNQHLQAWRIRYLDGMVYLFPKVPFDAAQHTISNHADPQYFALLGGGTAVALLALAFLVVNGAA